VALGYDEPRRRRELPTGGRRCRCRRDHVRTRRRDDWQEQHCESCRRPRGDRPSVSAGHSAATRSAGWPSFRNA